MNNIENWGDTKQKAYKKCNMNYEERNMVDKSIEEDNIIMVASMRSDGKIDCTYNYGITSVDLIA